MAFQGPPPPSSPEHHPTQPASRKVKSKEKSKKEVKSGQADHFLLREKEEYSSKKRKFGKLFGFSAKFLSENVKTTKFALLHFCRKNICFKDVSVL